MSRIEPSNDAFVWQGREDTQESGPTPRWHQHVQPLSDQADGQGGVTLIGFAVDEGVRRNSGRTGASQGPLAARQALANLPVLGEPAVFDAGDVTCEGEQLELAQQALAHRVAQALGRHSFPLVIGGGHEMAWGTFQGIVSSPIAPRRLLIVNLDAHFDLREAAQPNSGTPFRQMQQWCAAQHRPFDYRVFGISRFSNTQALFDHAQASGVRHWTDESLQHPTGLQAAMAELANDLVACEAVYLTICLDVLPATQAPGVSAPSVLGVPLHLIEAIVDRVLACGKLMAADIAELNPRLDRDTLTARTAARLAARIARRAPFTQPAQL
jgi:formiminoglutamase